MRTRSDLFKKLEDAQDLISQRDFESALKRLQPLEQEEVFVRRLMIECLFNLESDEELIQLIGVPRNVLEFTYVVEALWRRKKFEELGNLMEKSRKNRDIAESSPFKRMESKLKDRGIDEENKIPN